jgi:hypothetical protein
LRHIVRACSSGGGLNGGVSKSELRAMSVEMLRFGGDSRRLLNAVMVSDSILEVAGCWHPGDPGDVRLSEDIEVIVEVAI